MPTPDTLYSAAMAGRYDADFEAIFGGADRGDLGLFCALAARAGGPICEVGAGTGRVLLAVAAAAPAAPVVGVEPSAPMRTNLEARLAELDPRVGARVGVRDGAFGQLPLSDGSQALVYSAFRSFQHVLEVPDQLAALAEIRRVLRPGGRLAIDLFDPDYRLLCDAEPTLVTTYRTPAGATVERYDSRTVERARQRVDVGFRWIERDQWGRVCSDDQARYAIRYTFPWELVHLLARVGFEDVELYGDYQGGPVGAEPRELVVLARAPGGGGPGARVRG